MKGSFDVMSSFSRSLSKFNFKNFPFHQDHSVEILRVGMKYLIEYKLVVSHPIVLEVKCQIKFSKSNYYWAGIKQKYLSIL